MWITGGVIGVRVAKGQDHPCLGQSPHPVQRHVLWRDGHLQVRQTLCSAQQQFHILVRHCPDQCAVMRPLPRHGQMRPFQMQPNNPRHTVVQRRCNRVNGGAGPVWRVGDQRRQERRCAKLRMGVGDGAQRVDGWILLNKKCLLIELH